jgi:hypothetical protein
MEAEQSEARICFCAGARELNSCNPYPVGPMSQVEHRGKLRR